MLTNTNFDCTFTVAASSPTEAGTYFVNVTTNNSETFGDSSEFGKNYTLSLTGTTDYNSTPSVSVNGVLSGAYDVPVENENVYSNVSTSSETLLSTLVTASDGDTADTPNGNISTYLLHVSQNQAFNRIHPRIRRFDSKGALIK